MAKCTICNSRKGKRKCMATDSFICSQCCGESRSAKKCNGCSFFKGSSARRNYRRLPFFTIEQMECSPEKERIAMVVENKVSLIWNRNKAYVNDGTVQQLVEMLLDGYHFGEDPSTIDDPLLADCYRELYEEIEEELTDVTAEHLVMVLGAVYRSIQRRTNGGCSYLQFINRFTGGQYMV